VRLAADQLADDVRIERNTAQSNAGAGRPG
jgi:hypothetical protein